MELSRVALSRQSDNWQNSNMREYKQAFESLIWVKNEPNIQEQALLKRGQKYIQKLSKIPGIEMIAIVNSLSMYATHEDSDIDLFIVTQSGLIWFVRFFATIILWTHWVWRRDADIAGNLCLSFIITTEAMDLSRIAIEDDIYLYYWIYYMRPIYVRNETYERFLAANSWVDVNEEQKIWNSQYLIHPDAHFASLFWEFFESVDEIFAKIRNCLRQGRVFRIFKNKSETDSKTNKPKKDFLFLFSHKKKEAIYEKINTLIRYFLLPRTQRTYEWLGKPEWVIISDQMLKFHDRDRRKEIHDRLI